MHACIHTLTHMCMYACTRTLSLALSHTQSADSALVYSLTSLPRIYVGAHVGVCSKRERDRAPARDFDTFAFARSALASSCRAAK